VRGVAAVCVLAVLAACGGSAASDSLSPAAEDGRRTARRAGCAACHGADGEGGIGPAWDDSLGAEVELADGTTVVVDEEYLTRAIADPSAQLRDGFDVTMPGTDLTDDEIAAIVTYIVELNAGASG
jgi:cytochrome c oxidase subunit 2